MGRHRPSSGKLSGAALAGWRGLTRGRSCCGSVCHGLAASGGTKAPVPPSTPSVSCQLNLCGQYEPPGNRASLLTGRDFPAPGPGWGELGVPGRRFLIAGTSGLPSCQGSGQEPQMSNQAAFRRAATTLCVPQAAGPLLGPGEPASSPFGCVDSVRLRWPREAPAGALWGCSTSLGRTRLPGHKAHLPRLPLGHQDMLLGGGLRLLTERSPPLRGSTQHPPTQVHTGPTQRTGAAEGVSLHG